MQTRRPPPGTRPSGTPGEELIRVEHLQKSYGGSTPLRDVNAVVRRGEVIAVIGPSGSGKSSLLRCLNRLETPTAGRITVLGRELTGGGAELAAVRQRMGMVFQSFQLFPHLTALENVTLAPIRLRGLPPQQAAARGMALLQRQLAIEKEAARQIVFKAMNTACGEWHKAYPDSWLVTRESVLAAPADKDVTQDILARMKSVEVAFPDLPVVTIREPVREEAKSQTPGSGSSSGTQAGKRR